MASTTTTTISNAMTTSLHNNLNNTPNSMIKSVNSLKSTSSIMTSSQCSSVNNNNNITNINNSKSINQSSNQSTNNTNSMCTNEDYLNKKITFIQNHINNLLIEITNLPEPWSYAVTEDGRVFFINEEEQRTTWLHPKTGQPVSLMIIPPIEDLPNGWQKDYILGLPYLIDHNSKKNYPINILNNTKLTQEQENTSTNNTSNNSKMRSPSKSTEDFKSNNVAISSESINNMENNLISAMSSSSTSTSSSQSSTANSNQTKNLNGNIVQSNTVQVNTAIDSALRKYGWLYKLSQNGLKLWRKRYFVLTDYILDYYSDSTMSKHCGTIFLNNTHSRPTVKKDGSSAYNKKNSFKVELINTEGESNESYNDMYVYLAADSSGSMNEWINKFNFVSKLKNNTQNRNLYEKRVASNRSSSNTSTRTNPSNSNYFIIKHDNSNSKRSSKASSAPSSPNINSRNLHNENSGKKLRSSLSSSTNKLDDKKKPIKKKLAFSDDEILNDRPSKSKSSNNPKTTNKKKESNVSDVDTDYEGNERLNNSYNQKYLNDSFEGDSKSKHKRSSSLTKSSQKSSSSSMTPNLSRSNKTGSSNHIYDYKSIYDAFEKPIIEMSKMTQSMINNQSSLNEDLSRDRDSSVKNHHKSRQSMDKFDPSEFFQPASSQKSFNQRNMESFMDRDKFDKITAAAEAAAAAAAALEKDKDKDRIMFSMKPPGSCISTSSKSSNKNYSPRNVNSKVITNFYQITKAQIESLQKNELDMLMRQLRRNFVLLNHSHQRFSLLQKLYEPYELLYQHRQNQSQMGNNKNDEAYGMNELTLYLHDSYQTIKDRIKRIEHRVDLVENSIKIGKGIENSTQKIYEDPNNLDSDRINSINKFSNILKLFEYQIVEMQHENELLLEDKIIVDKLLDNQMRIFSKYQNLSNEKTLIQQFNALNQEMDLLKEQIFKVNQLLNDTISDKCKHELIYQQQLNKSQPSSNQDNSSLFRASLIPVGNPSSSNSSTNMESSKMTSSIWKLNSPNLVHSKKIITQANSQFGSTDNLISQGSQSTRSNVQLNQSVSVHSQPQVKSTYQAHHHQYYLNSQNNNLINNNSSKLNENNLISKSIDSIYSPAGSTTSSNKISNGYSAFNSINNSNKKTTTFSTEINDELSKQDSFQPVNFTNSRPKQINVVHQQSSHSTAFVPAKGSNFKRDILAEKKRSSIGKYPQNYYSQNRDYFQPIPLQNSQQTARERLFGNQQQGLGSVESEQVNSRKIALVKPELRGSCDNDIINRFTQQTQMEYFDADYSEEIVKNIQKPEVYNIPRGNIEYEPEIELNEEEKRAKEKRILDLKKMIVVQSLQQMSLEDQNSNLSNGHLNGKNVNFGYGNSTNGSYSPEFNFQKEKKAREQLLELRHDIVEQIKEKSRQSALNSSSNALLTPSSSIDLIDNRITETPKQIITLQTPNSKIYSASADSENYYDYYDEEENRKIYEHQTYYSIHSVYDNDLINSTPTLPAQYKAFFNSTSILNGKNF